jgi:hypothetical protein
MSTENQLGKHIDMKIGFYKKNHTGEFENIRTFENREELAYWFDRNEFHFRKNISGYYELSAKDMEDLVSRAEDIIDNFSENFLLPRKTILKNEYLNDLKEYIGIFKNIKHNVYVDINN